MGQLMLAAAAAVALTSPSKAITFELTTDATHRLVYSVSLDKHPVIEASPLGIIVDGKNLADGVDIGKTETYDVDERYPWTGVHSTAINRCRGARIAGRCRR